VDSSVLHTDIPDKDESHPVNKWLREFQHQHGTSQPRVVSSQESLDQAQQALEHALARQELNTNIAKNVIVFIADGMGVSTVTAARILAGGERHQLSFDKFPHVAYSKTYAADWQTTDSGAAATAMLCGIKNPFSTICVTPNAVQAICTTQAGNEVESILYKAQRAGKSTGVVSNTALTHATPAAAYATSVFRDWESDADMRPYPFTSACSDIAKQFIEKGHNIEVALGGGRSKFLPREEVDPEEPERTGDRRDGRNLIREWEADKEEKGRSYAAVTNGPDFRNIDPSNTDYLFGLFSRGHMSYEDSRTESQPSLTEMTEKAIQILQKNDNGYFLVVEGGRIDMAHHASRARRALEETISFSDAIQKAVDLTSEEDTLIIVTSDHSHVLAFGGYSPLGSNILGTSLTPSTVDLMPYTTLTYGNGPGFDHEAGVNGRENLFGVDTGDINYIQQSAVPLGEETHGGEDVGIYARGPMAHLFHGVQENTFVMHVAAYASCIGDDKRHCDNQSAVNHSPRK